MINDRRLLDLMRRVIAIDSQNPPGNEEAIAGFVRDYLRSIGLRTRTVTLRPRRQNVLAWLPAATRNAKTLLITPHLDTVPVGTGWKHTPLAATVEKGRMFGLGTTDCKGNLAVAMEAMHSLVEDKARLPYTLLFAATADEESGSTWGLIPLLEKKIIAADAALVLDADDFEIVVSQKGLLHVKVSITGKKAHGAYPWLGVNAIDQAGRIVCDLQKYRFPGRTRNRYLRGPTVNVGTIRGGDKVNVVAGWCEFELDFRFLPGMSAQRLLADLQTIVRRHARHFRITHDGIQQPYTIDTGHPLVTCLSSAMARHRIIPRIRGSEGATVITFFQHKGIPAIATGVGREGCAHVADEYVPVANLTRGARCLETFLKEFTF